MNVVGLDKRALQICTFCDAMRWSLCRVGLLSRYTYVMFPILSEFLIPHFATNCSVRISINQIFFMSGFSATFY